MTSVRRRRWKSQLVLSASCWTLLFVGGASAWELDAESLFDRDKLLEIEIEMAADDWEALRSDTRPIAEALRKPAVASPFAYAPADIRVNGRLIRSVGIRKKGFVGSLDQVYPSLKVKFNEYRKQSPLGGLRRLTLNNNKQDSTVIGQTLAYAFFAKLGLPAPRCNLARVTVNGEYLGLYSNVESVKSPFLERVFGNSKGKLYEGTLADFYPDRVTDLEAKNKKADDRSELSGLAELLAEDGKLDVERLATRLDVDQFLRFWATESLLNVWDGYTNNQNNYFVYLDPKDNKLRFIPWGVDASFLRWEFVKSPSESVHSASVLANRLYGHDKMQTLYRGALVEILDEHWDEDSILDEIDQLEAFVKPHLHPRQRGFDRGIAALRKFVKTRRNEMEYELDRWPVRIEKAPRRPAFTTSVGHASGTFRLTWGTKPKQPYDAGEAKLAMVLDGESVEFSRLGVYGIQEGNEKERTRSIVFVGKRKSNGIRVKLTLALSDARFHTAAGGRPVVAQGNLEEGGFGLFGLLSTNGVRLATGRVTLTQFGADPGQELEGTVQAEFVRFKDGQ